MEKRMVIEQLSPSSVDHHDGHDRDPIHEGDSCRSRAEGGLGDWTCWSSNEMRSVIRGSDSFFVLAHKNNYP